MIDPTFSFVVWTQGFLLANQVLGPRLQSPHIFKDSFAKELTSTAVPVYFSVFYISCVLSSTFNSSYSPLPCNTTICLVILFVKICFSVIQYFCKEYLYANDSVHLEYFLMAYYPECVYLAGISS
jgi:hypothetical protein